MLDLANLSEFSVGTLYNFFKSKEELCYNLLIEKLDFFQLRLDTDVNQHPVGHPQILALIEATGKFFQENQGFFRDFPPGTGTRHNTQALMNYRNALGGSNIGKAWLGKAIGAK